MDKNTKKVMTSVRRKLTKAINLHVTACGREGDLAKAFAAEFDLISFVEAELVKRDFYNSIGGPG